MKHLLIMRHAKSDWGEPGLPDHDRPLNERGKRDAPRAGQWLANQGWVPDWIVCSTAKRARKTASRVAEACGYAVEVSETKTLYLAEPEEYLRVLRESPPHAARVLAIGHNPGLEMLCELLVSQSQEFATAAIASIELPIDRWTDFQIDGTARLLAMWRPREDES